jgi:hypothetical protein
MGEQEIEFSIETEMELNRQSFEIKYNLKNLKKEKSHLHLHPRLIKQNNYEFYDEPFVNDNETQIFFLFETEAHTVFGHWVHESAVFLPFFEKVKEKYKKIKILVNSNPKRTYKKLFMDIFEIPEDKRTFLDNEPIFDYSVDAYLNIPINNICVVCNTIPLSEFRPEKIDLLLYLIDNLKNTIYIKHPELNTYNEKTIEHLFLPRNKLENYHNRGADMDYTFVNELLQNKTYTKYDTNNTTDFKEQIKLLLSSQNIYLDFGSSLLVNGLFCKNSTLYITALYEWHLGFFKYIEKLIQYLKKNNNIIFLTNSEGQRLWNVSLDNQE